MRLKQYLQPLTDERVRLIKQKNLKNEIETFKAKSAQQVLCLIKQKNLKNEIETTKGAALTFRPSKRSNRRISRMRLKLIDKNRSPLMNDRSNRRISRMRLKLFVRELLCRDRFRIKQKNLKNEIETPELRAGAPFSLQRSNRRISRMRLKLPCP